VVDSQLDKPRKSFQTVALRVVPVTNVCRGRQVNHITSAVGGVRWSAAVIAVASLGGPQEETWSEKKNPATTTIYSSVPFNKNSDLAGTLRTAFQRFRSGTVETRARKVSVFEVEQECRSAETPGLLQRVSQRLYDVLPLSARIRNVSHRYGIQTVRGTTLLPAHTH